MGLQLPNPNASKANAHPANSLEALLATKNKRILEELTKFRVRLSSPLVVASNANLAQILHGEREASLQRAREDLASTTSELERHRELNERLESDLLKIEQHGQGRSDQENGDANLVETGEDDILAGLGLELGLTTKDVRFPNYCPMQILTLVMGRRNLWHKRNLYLSHPPLIHPFFPSSQANATASVNVMLNLKR